MSLEPGRCAVIGGGLAGAAAAASLARRGWQVQVLDAAEHPASGASALPAGLLAPHVSKDDNLLSRLSRAGVQLTLREAQALLRSGEDWQRTGVCERRADGVIQHEDAGWIKPAALVRAWLAQAGISWRGNARVAQLQRSGSDWQLLDAQGLELARASLVVVAAAVGTARLLDDRVALTPVRGQVSWGPRAASLQLPSQPLNGNGHFLPDVPSGAERIWLTGSTYGRGDTGLEARPADHAANFARLTELAPDVARALAPQFETTAVQAWTGVRCTSTDRRPLVGEIEPGLWVSTAMGSRGLTFAMLCAELMAARLHAKPLPLEAKLAAALDVHRSMGRRPAPLGRR